MESCFQVRAVPVTYIQGVQHAMPLPVIVSPSLHKGQDTQLLPYLKVYMPRTQLTLLQYLKVYMPRA